MQQRLHAASGSSENEQANSAATDAGGGLYTRNGRAAEQCWSERSEEAGEAALLEGRRGGADRESPQHAHPLSPSPPFAPPAFAALRLTLWPPLPLPLLDAAAFFCAAASLVA